MKIDARRIEAFLRDPGPARVVLFMGDDDGLIREYAARLVKSTAGALNDPFRVSDIERDGFVRLVDEVAERSLTGGRRVVRVREATDAATAPVQAVLSASGEGLLVMEGAGLGGKSRLKTLLERSDHGAVVVCYPMDSRAVAQLARAVLAEDSISIEQDALAWLVGQLGADRAITRSELEKLVLYIGPGGALATTDAREIVGDLSGLSLEDALFFATDGDAAGADRALELAIQEGATPVGIIRAALMHVQRLLRARIVLDSGKPIEEVLRALRPPIFFRREGVFSRSLRAWSTSGLGAVAQRLFEAERACKRTGAPADILCRNAIIGLAQRGGMARGRFSPG